MNTNTDSITMVDGVGDSSTLYDALRETPMPVRGSRGRVRAGTPMIPDGLNIEPFQNSVGYRVIAPEELLSIRIPGLKISGREIKGYQRPIKMRHAIDLAWAILDGEPIQNIQVSIDEKGQMGYFTDGQHRAIASVITRRPLAAVVEQRSYQEAKRMFLLQDMAMKLPRNHMVIIGDDAMSRYVQDAVTNKAHPWSAMVHPTNTHKLTPSVMHRLVTMYGCNIVGSLTAQHRERAQDQFVASRADDLAELIAVFGCDADGVFDRRNNALAFHQANLSALVQAAVFIFIRADDVHPAQDRERWKRHMVKFPWARYLHLNSQRDITEAMLTHWNKHLTSRKIERRVFEKGSLQAGRRSTSFAR